MRGRFVIVDIDGTISKVGERLKFLNQTPPDWDSFYNDCFEDEPIEPIVRLVSVLMNTPGYKIVFCSGRRESCREKTRLWLENNLRPTYLNYHKFTAIPILLRPDSNHRHDAEIKPEMLKAAGFTPENVEFILEDRNSMVKKWRELGFTCLQVADGDF